MDLSDEIEMSPEIEVTFTRSSNLVRNTHQQVQIHVGIDEVWPGLISEGSSEKNLCTIVVGAIVVNGWDLADREVEGRRQSRLVGNLSEALQRNQYSPSMSLRVTRSPPSPPRANLRVRPQRATSTHV